MQAMPNMLVLHIHADVRPHKIMGYVEQIQIQHYLGSSWLFGSGELMNVLIMRQPACLHGCRHLQLEPPTCGCDGT